MIDTHSDIAVSKLQGCGSAEKADGAMPRERKGNKPGFLEAMRRPHGLGGSERPT